LNFLPTIDTLYGQERASLYSTMLQDVAEVGANV
jgi:hypothetical protein